MQLTIGRNRSSWIQINNTLVKKFDKTETQNTYVEIPLVVKCKKPYVNGYKKTRLCKDIVYLKIAEIAEKYKIRGPYIGLAAAQALEISQILSKHVTSILSFQRRTKDYIEICEYFRFLNIALKNIKSYTGSIVNFEVKPYEILEYLISMADLNIPKSGSIFDFDFMCNLTNTLINNIVYALNCTKFSDFQTPDEKALVAIWHFVGRGNTKNDVEQYLRPYLYQSLRKDFRILDKTIIKYFESSPMRCEIVVISRT